MHRFILNCKYVFGFPGFAVVDHIWRYMTYIPMMDVSMKNQKHSATICGFIFD